MTIEPFLSVVLSVFPFLYLSMSFSHYFDTNNTFKSLAKSPENCGKNKKNSVVWTILFNLRWPFRGVPQWCPLSVITITGNQWHHSSDITDVSDYDSSHTTRSSKSSLIKYHFNYACSAWYSGLKTKSGTNCRGWKKYSVLMKTSP